MSGVSPATAVSPVRPDNTEPVLSLSGVGRDYVTGSTVTTALRDVSLEIAAGEFVSIIGPSGSGKSTLMNIIGALDRPTSGQVLLNGRDISTLDDNQLTDLRGRSIGFVFQQFQLLPTTSALDNVAAPLLYQGTSRRQARRRASVALDRLGLGDRLHHDRTQLSGGQQQRVAIARALVGEPSLILADEPTGALDTVSGQAVLDLLVELNEEGRTIVVITHDPDVAARAHRVIRVLDGRVVADDPAGRSAEAMGMGDLR